MLLPLKSCASSAKNNQVSDRRKSCERTNISFGTFTFRASVAAVRHAGIKLFLLPVLILALPLEAAPLHNEIISLHLWQESEPLIWTQEEPRATEETYRELLREAGEILSGMLYGYDFYYVPYDKSRNIAEEFKLTPLARIQWGDPNLKIAATERRGNRVYVKLNYYLESFQEARRKAWSSNTFPIISGNGRGNLFAGTTAKSESISQAIKEAIRNHLRPRVFNKPRKVSGQLLIWKEPHIIIQEGSYLTRVTIKLHIGEITSYRIF